LGTTLLERAAATTAHVGDFVVFVLPGGSSAICFWFSGVSFLLFRLARIPGGQNADCKAMFTSEGFESLNALLTMLKSRT